MELFTKRRVKLRPVPTQHGLEEKELMLGKNLWKGKKLNLILKTETPKQFI